MEKLDGLGSLMSERRGQAGCYYLSLVFISKGSMVRAHTPEATRGYREDLAPRNILSQSETQIEDDMLSV